MVSRWRALTLWFTLLSTAAAADPSTFEPHDGVLILRNGFVLPGRITSVGESYIVSFGDRGEARVPRTEVEFQCRSIDEAYLIKRDTLSYGDVKSHLELADWSLRHGLLARAADQLLVVRLKNPSHPQLLSLERRVESLATMSATPAAAAPANPPARPAAAATPAAYGSSPDLPPFLVQQFTVTVQPILLNRCATHACHGPAGSSSYRLLRPSLGQAATSRLTHRNLQATLAFIDRSDPGASRLLKMAEQAHGGALATFANDKTQTSLDLLASWVRRLGMNFPSAQPVPTTPDTLVAGAPAAKRQPAPTGARSAGAFGEVKPAAHLEPPLPSGGEPAAISDAAAPADPFDPEVFNRRFHPQARSAATPAYVPASP